MRRCWAVVGLAIVAGCEAPVERAPQPAFVYPPQPATWPLAATSTIGRAQSPQVALRGGITGSVTGQLRLPTPWQVPGEGPARAIVYGSLDGQQAIELIDIDAGRLVWRDTTLCAAPVVGVTAQTVVCADGAEVRAITLDGKLRWKQDGAFVAMTDNRVVLAGAGEAVIVDADIGDEVAHIKLPPGVKAESILASCGDDGRELFASGQDNRLVRIANAKAAWAVTTDRIIDIDACEGATIVVTMAHASGATVAAFSRDAGKETGRIDGTLGLWTARDGSPRVEIATATTILRVSRDLIGPREPLEALRVGNLLATRGDLRLVRASATTAVLLDAKGVRAYLPLANPGAVLGERALIASTWSGSPGETVHRVPYPARYPRELHLVPGPARAIVLPAELRDLPPITDAPAPIAAETKGEVKGIAIADDKLYAALESPSGIAVFDLRAKRWGAAPPNPCSVTPIGVAAAPRQVVCAGRDDKAARVSALTWSWTAANVDRIEATANVVLAFDADRVSVIDNGGKQIALLASGNGAAMPAAALDLAGTTMVVTAEQNRIVAHLPYVEMVPAWTVDVAGVVVAIAAAGDGVLVTLEDGDAYRIDARTGTAVAVAGIASEWRASGDLITSAGDGGPIPPAGWPPAAGADAPAPKGKRAGKAAAKTAAADAEPRPPRLMTPIPPPAELRPSFHYALHELTGGVRARNDYALEPPVTPAATRTPGASLVLIYGERDHLALVLDPMNGDPFRRVRLPAEALPHTAFSTVVDGKPQVGILVANPLRVLLF